MPKELWDYSIRRNSLEIHGMFKVWTLHLCLDWNIYNLDFGPELESCGQGDSGIWTTETVFFHSYFANPVTVRKVESMFIKWSKIIDMHVRHGTSSLHFLLIVGGYHNTDTINRKMEQIIYRPILTFKKRFNGKLFFIRRWKILCPIVSYNLSKISKFNIKNNLQRR